MVTLEPVPGWALLNLPVFYFSPLLLTQWVLFNTEEVARKLKLMFE